MNTAFIIGNGTSRKGFELTKLKPYGTIYGCNALYRDYFDNSIPDFLVAIDDGIITEIEGSDFPSKRFIVPPMDERWEPAECNIGRPRSNAWYQCHARSYQDGIQSADLSWFMTF